METINKLPSLTWSWLKINEAHLDDDVSLLKKNTTSRLRSMSKTDEIVAEDGEKQNVVMVFSSENDEKLQIVQTHIVARKNAIVNLFKIQILPKEQTIIDETDCECDENASVNVYHIVLGGDKTYIEVKADLNGKKSSFNSRLAYLLKENQELDMNYVVRQIGKKTDCKMNVSGTLKDNAKKTYRGTIDFKKGCSGSKGNEQEETLLLSENAVNKSIPVILCDEEDVEGEHGMTSGRLRDEVLFYMQSRAISLEDAENIIATSKIMSVLSLLEDEKVVEMVQNKLSCDIMEKAR